MIADMPLYGIVIQHKLRHFEWPSILKDQTFLRKNNPTYCNMFMSSRDWRTETGCIWNDAISNDHAILKDHTFLRKNNPTYCNMFMSSRDWRTETGCIWNASWTQILDKSTFQWAYITKSTCPRSSIPVLIFIFVCSDSCTLNFK